MRVLLVDDSAIMRMMLRSLLKQVQLTDVVEAENGLEGIGILRSKKIDLVLLDLHMPEMDGIAFLKTVKGEPPLSAVPVIIVSSDADARQIDEAQRLGACSYVTKPFRLEGLRDALSCAFPQPN